MVSGDAALAALAVASSVFTLLLSVFISLLSVTSTVMNLSYGEGDRDSLDRTLYVSLRLGYRVGAVLFIALFVFAGAVSRIFLKVSDVEVLAQATRFIRCYSLQSFLALISYSIGGSFMGTGNVKLNYVLCVLRDAIFPVVCAASAGFLFGIRGVEAGLVISGVLTLVTAILIPGIKNRRIPRSLDGLLILPESFVPEEGEILEASMSTAGDVSEVSGKVQEYCLARGEDKKTALFVSLFVEEMAGNTVRHGFERKKTGLIELRLVMRKDKRMIRLRDNGMSFDPVKWLEVNKQNNTESNIGIRMIVGLAKEIDYLPSMGLNNIVVKL
jgi:anti-sigma regulatory factor (Ser/Thr protein kinase)